MSPLRALRWLVADLAALFDRGQARLWFLLIASLVLQVGFWSVAGHGPAYLGAWPRTLAGGVLTVLGAVVFLLAVPALLMGAVGSSLREAGLRLGDARFGLAAALAGAPAMVAVAYLGSFGRSIQAVYPLAGDWPGRTLAALAAWVGIYALYYLAFEFFYRGFLLSLLAPAWGPTAAIWVQTVASSLVHLGKPMPEVLAAIPAGLLFGVLAWRGRSVLYPALLHLVVGAATDVFSLAHQGHLLGH